MQAFVFLLKKYLTCSIGLDISQAGQGCMAEKSSETISSLLLGDYDFKCQRFANLEQVLEIFQQAAFKKLAINEQFKRINQTLLELILNAPRESFLLPAVLEFTRNVDVRKILYEPYLFSSFEFWLNHFSGLSDQENYAVRSKIAGKGIPREDYQVFFPIGMGKVFSGTHFVTAHLSPDVDTTIASFWGWVDAFAAKVGNGLHIWGLPGGPPDSPVTHVFQEMFGPSVFSHAARMNGNLTLAAVDVVTQRNFIKANMRTPISSMDHGLNQNAIILVDENGYYLGDWRSSDVETVGQILILFKACLRWFENDLHLKFISLFTKEDLRKEHLLKCIEEIFIISIADSEPVSEFSEKQKQILTGFFCQIFNLSKGLLSTFAEFAQALVKLSVNELWECFETVASWRRSELFDVHGKVIEDRPRIFCQLQKIIDQMHQAVNAVRSYVERLDVAMQIKRLVLGHPSEYILKDTDIEDIRFKIKNLDYLTVAVQDRNSKLFPLGVVWANHVRQGTLGTVAFRDFCNSEEVRMASYLTVISVIDHHKTSLNTISPPMALIGDAQSCNVLVAEQAFILNERYGMGGMSEQFVELQLKQLNKESPTTQEVRLQQRLLQRRMAAQSASSCFVNPQREFAEYLLFLHAILDDTDLLTKVSSRDVECVAQLLNRMKSLSVKKEVEIIDLDQIPRTKDFAKVAAKVILQNEDMYSVYRKIYAFKEQEVELNLKLCLEGKESNFFQDTKEQNGCCRVGQTKIFSSNVPIFFENICRLREAWYKKALEIYNNRPGLDLHLHMISTIASAQEVYTGAQGQYSHQDELWGWIPDQQTAKHHLGNFLNAFQTAPEVLGNQMEVLLTRSNADGLEHIFLHNFRPIPIKRVDKGLPLFVLRFKAGSLNSRKSMVTPYLPRFIA